MLKPRGMIEEPDNTNPSSSIMNGFYSSELNTAVSLVTDKIASVSP